MLSAMVIDMEPTNPKNINPEQYKRPLKGKEKEAQVVQLLIKSGLFLQRELNQVCQRHGLNTNQFSAINEIIMHGPISQKELCERLLFEKSNVSKIIKNLQDKGLIKITVATNDRRSTLIIETWQGSEIWEKCLHSFYDSSTRLISVLSAEELRNTLRLMKMLEKGFMRMADK